jgi:glycosyltransferase involved in cell wall biosynthesis
MSELRPRLLFITPKIDEGHDDLAFASLWAQAFQDAGYDVTVICGEKGMTRLTCPVYGLGHVPGKTRFSSFWKFQKLITTLKYDRVFVHLGQRWLGAGGWYWWLKGIPTYLWYTHYTRPLSLRIGEMALTRTFCATKDSQPYFEGDPRKIVTGHGIDTAFWDVPALPESEREPVTDLLCVHRISRSKRFELVLKALALLPAEYTVTHFGRPQDPINDPEYAAEIDGLIRNLNLKDRVKMMGSVPMGELRNVYPHYRAFINMVPKTIDKTALEAMYCGLTPIMAQDQAEAIGWNEYPKDLSPEAIADYIKHLRLASREELKKIVEEKHSLKNLIEKMSVYIKPGN